MTGLEKPIRRQFYQNRKKKQNKSENAACEQKPLAKSNFLFIQRFLNLPKI